MASTNKTANVALPQFTDDDKPSWLGDVNDAMRKIDAEFGRLQGLIDSLQTQVNNKQDKVTP